MLDGKELWSLFCGVYSIFLSYRPASRLAVLFCILIVVFIVFFEWRYPYNKMLDVNVLILNASSSEEKALFFMDAFAKKYNLDKKNISYSDKWKNKHFLVVTRIIFIPKEGKDNEKIAEKICSELVGTAMIINYNDQEKTSGKIFPEESPLHTNNFTGFDPSRDIVIILGDDFYGNQ